MYRNAFPANQFTERSGLMFLLIWSFLMFTSTFTTMVIAGVESAESGGHIAQLMFSLCLIFCGVLAGPSQLPGFWIFMYRVSPFTYLVDAMLSVGLANTNIVCQTREYLHVDAPSNMTCGEYFAPYISYAGGYILDPSATSDCQFCSVADTNTFLLSLSSNYANRWRNFGLMWVYIVFNAGMAIFLYWLARVPKNTGKEEPPTAEELQLQRTRTAASGAAAEKTVSRSRTWSKGGKA
jgi:ATP-binding cassette subfamily G (WHITE) protein 2 (PDR)